MADLTAQIIDDFNAFSTQSLTHKYYNNDLGGRELSNYYKKKRTKGSQVTHVK